MVMKTHCWLQYSVYHKVIVLPIIAFIDSPIDIINPTIPKSLVTNLMDLASEYELILVVKNSKDLKI